MIDPQILTTALSALAVFVGIAGYLHAVKQDLTRHLETQIVSLETRLTDKIDGVKADVVDLKADVVDVRASVRVLEQRTFDMVHRGAATDSGPGSA